MNEDTGFDVLKAAGPRLSAIAGIMAISEIIAAEGCTAEEGDHYQDVILLCLKKLGVSYEDGVAAMKLMEDVGEGE